MNVDFINIIIIDGKKKQRLSMIVGKIKDLSTYKSISTSLDEAIDYVLKDGGFVILFPEDVHCPGIRVDDQEIEKVVIKIKI